MENRKTPRVRCLDTIHRYLVSPDQAQRGVTAAAKIPPGYIYNTFLRNPFLRSIPSIRDVARYVPYAAKMPGNPRQPNRSGVCI